MSAFRIFEKKIVLCKKGDEITGLDGTTYLFIKNLFEREKFVLFS
jgi:hypothetical protein